MDDNLQDLPRHVRRKILREQEKEKEGQRQVTGKLVKWLIGLLVVVAVLGGGYWLVKSSTRSLPGEAVADAGRAHVTDISGVTYTSNPPSSGPHFPVWAKPGVYDRLISAGYLIHSMEHGYVIIWYDCEKQLSIYNLQFTIPVASAHGDEPIATSTPSAKPLTHMTVQPSGDMSWITPQTEPAEEVVLPDSFKTDSCKSLVSQLSEFTKVAQRVIVAPRLNMDHPIILTAWDRIDKVNSVDKEEIKKFIKAFHNRGPEKTME